MNDYLKLKKKVDELRREADEAAGARNQIMKELKKTYGVETIDEAKRLLRKLEKKEKRLQREFDEALSEFEEKWKDKLGD